jgi:hypothetical protein
MYLILGEPPPSLAGSLRTGFDAMDAEILWVTDLISQVELVWRLDTSCSTFELHLENGRTLDEEQLLGVVTLAPSNGDNSEIKEKEYFRAEKRATLLAWLWSLQCPVINRIPPMLCISTHVPLALWRPALGRCGLPAVDSILSNLPSELEKFVSELSGECDYVPLSIKEVYRVATPADFDGLMKLTQFCPVSLTQYGPLTYMACIVKRNVFWNQSGPPVLTTLQDRLMQLTVITGLSFLEVGVVVAGGTPSVFSINPFPELDQFEPETCHGIAEALLDILRSD